MKVNTMDFLIGMMDDGSNVMIGEIHRREYGYLILACGEENTRLLINNDEVLAHGGLIAATKYLHTTAMTEHMQHAAAAVHDVLVAHVEQMNSKV